MGLKFGFNIGTSDMKSLLEKNQKQMSGVRTWKQLFGSAAQSYATQASALTSAYGDTIAQAYKASMAQSDAIASAGLNLGATQELMANNRAALHSAYQTYVQNYAEAATANAQNYANTVEAYDKDLTAEAKNYSKLYNYAYKYLTEELVGSTYAGNTGGTVANGTSWLTANKLDWLYNADTGQAKSWQELTKGDTALFNSAGELTNYGREFFDAMFNVQAGGYKTSEGKATRGFDQWLSDTDVELRDWYASGDAFNYTTRGTVAGTAKSLLGIDSNKDAYKYQDYVHLTDKIKLPEIDFSVPGYDIAEADRLYKDMLNKKAEYEHEYSIYGGSSGSANAEHAYRLAEQKYNSYVADTNAAFKKAQTNVKAEYDKAITQLKDTIGEDAYEKWATTPGIKEDLEMLESLFTDSVYDTETPAKLAEYYKRFQRWLDMAIKSNLRGDKSTGF